MLRKALSQSWASASSAAGHQNNNHVAALLAQVRPGATVGGTFGTTVQPVRGQKSLPVVDAAAPLPPAAYSPFGTKQKSMGEWTVARLDDLLNWGRKGECTAGMGGGGTSIRGIVDGLQFWDSAKVRSGSTKNDTELNKTNQHPFQFTCFLSVHETTT